MLTDWLTQVNGRMRSAFQSWVNRRIPPAKSITLNQRRIFIFPSRTGFAFLGLLLVMLLAAINYQNNMVFMLVFFLASLFFVTVHHTYANLSGLTIDALTAGEGFVNEPLCFKFRFSSKKNKSYFDVAVGWESDDTQLLHVPSGVEHSVDLFANGIKRGKQKPERLLIESIYPLGLLRAWTWLRLDVEAIVYPKPVKGELRAIAIEGDGEGELVAAAGEDELVGLKTYTPGDSLRRIYWKSYAKGQPLQSKDFSGLQSRQHYLDWRGVDGDTEMRLSVLTYQLLRADAGDNEYGLRLPDGEFEPGSGPQHRQKLLRALACFGEP